MRIAFDASPLRFPHSPGIARVVQQTLSTLAARNRIEVIRAQPDPGQSLRSWRWRTWPRSLRAGYQRSTGPMAGVQGVHTFQAAFPLWVPQPKVVTLHECSWKHGVREPGQARRRGWFAAAQRRAAAIVTATQHSARDIGRTHLHQGGRLHVIPWAAGDPFRPASMAGREPIPQGQDAAVIEAAGLQAGSYWLVPGGLHPKKRPDLLLQALQAWPQQAGAPRTVVWTAREENDRMGARLREQFPSIPQRVLAGPCDTTLAAWYRQACAVVVLSASEGFALPALEALASGTPVVVTPHSAQAEVAGSGGIVTRSEQPADVLAGLLCALDRAGPSRAARLARAAEFSWERTAAAIEDLWANVLGESCR